MTRSWTCSLKVGPSLHRYMVCQGTKIVKPVTELEKAGIGMNFESSDAPNGDQDKNVS